MMESEKVKEIKKALKFCCDECDCDCPFYRNGKSYDECKSLLLFEALTLINELESEKEKGQRKAVYYYQRAKFYGVECIVDNDIVEVEE